MPPWIKRWVKRVRSKFPELQVSCYFSIYYFGYVVELKYGLPFNLFPGHHSWKYWGILLNPSKYPTVRQNRKRFREHFDWGLEQEIKRLKIADGQTEATGRSPCVTPQE